MMWNSKKVPAHTNNNIAFQRSLDLRKEVKLIWNTSTNFQLSLYAQDQQNFPVGL